MVTAPGIFLVVVAFKRSLPMLSKIAEDMPTSSGLALGNSAALVVVASNRTPASEEMTRRAILPAIAKRIVMGKVNFPTNNGICCCCPPTPAAG